MIAYAKKENAQPEEGKRRCNYSSRYTIHRAVDYMEVKEFRGKKELSPRPAEPCVDVYSEDADSDMCNEEPDNRHVANGDGSEDELRRRLVGARPDFRAVRDEIAKLIDVRYYSVTVDGDRGLDITCIRTPQMNRDLALFLNAHRKLKHRNMRTIGNISIIVYIQRGQRDTRITQWIGIIGVLPGFTRAQFLSFCHPTCLHRRKSQLLRGFRLISHLALTDLE